MILEVDKNIDSSDYEIFLEYRPIDQINFEKKIFYDPHTTVVINSSNEETPTVSTYRTFPKDFRGYIDYFFEYNKEHETICKQFIGKQIYGNPELDLFIKQHFRTREQVSTILNLIPAYFALALTLAITIYQEWDNNKDINNILNKLSTIETQLEALSANSLTDSDIYNIEEKLEKIIESESSNSKINDTLEEILQEIKDYKESN